MFKIFIGGRTMAELKDNVRQCFEELEGKNSTVTRDDSQDRQEQVLNRAPTAAECKEAQDFLTDVAQKAMALERPIYPTFPPPLAPPPHIPAQVEQKSDMMEFGVDSKGLPWDERIHSVSQGVNKDGSWRYRRGVEDAQIEAVEQELIAKLKLGGHVTTPVVPPPPVPLPPPVQPVPMVQQPTPSAPPPPPVMARPEPPPIPAAPIQQPVAPPPAQPVATPTSPASIAQVLSAHTAQTFKDNLVATLTRLVAEKKLDQGYINQLKAYFQVEQIWQVNDVQAAEMFESFCANGLIVKAQ